MRILFLTSWYPTQKNPGAGIFIKEHAVAAKQAGNEVVVLAFIIEKSSKFFHIQTRDYIDENNMRVIEIILSSVFKDLLYYFPAIQQLIFSRLYERNHAHSFVPDIIHSNVVFPSGIFGAHIARKLDKPHVITEHWSKLPTILLFPLIKRKIVRAYSNADYILPVSAFLKNRILFSIPTLRSEHFFIVPNVIDSSIFFYQAKKPINNAIHFTAVANWATKRQPDKKPELFIQALSKIQQSIDKKIILTMIGSGNRVSELKKMCRDLNLTANFEGYKAKNQICDILHHTDFFVHASTIETFGVVVAEALITGTPVICSNVGALPELVNTSNGVLCENTVEEWELGILKAINNPFDSKKISENIAEKYSSENIGKNINERYKSLVCIDQYRLSKNKAD